MTEDEAFIRAIVDGPGDDTPRLVYADWLDDRDDPRGPYLRAEREAVATGDAGRLRELAVGLDPVWVARVSRPPVGVCCDHLRVRDSRPAVDAATLDSLEERLKLSLPPEHRALLLNRNGGKPKPNEYRPSWNKSSTYPDSIFWFHCVSAGTSPPEVGKGKPDDLEYATTVLNNGFVLRETNPAAHEKWAGGVREFVALAGPAGDLGLLAIGLTGRRAGKVYAINRGVLCAASAPRLVADSLPQFLAMLTATPGKG